MWGGEVTPPPAPLIYVVSAPILEEPRAGDGVVDEREATHARFGMPPSIHPSEGSEHARRGGRCEPIYLSVLRRVEKVTGPECLRFQEERPLRKIGGHQHAAVCYHQQSRSCKMPKKNGGGGGGPKKKR